MVSAQKVVFLGGPEDGMQLEIPANVAEFRFRRYADKPIDALVQEVNETGGQRPLKTEVVAYRRTPRVVNGRRVYSLVVSPD